MDRCVVIISHSNYVICSAGSEKAISENVDLLKDHNIHTIHLFPLININNKLSKIIPIKYKNRFTYYGVNIDGIFIGIYCIEDMYRALNQLVTDNEFVLGGVLLHHLYGWDLYNLKKFLFKINLPINLFIHDYMMICEYLYEKNGKGEVCGLLEPSMSKCNGCKYACISIKNHIAYRKFLDKIKHMICNVIVPSNSVKHNWLESIDLFQDNIIIRGHLQEQGRYYKQLNNKKIRIAYIGSKQKHKGYNEWNTLRDSLDKDQYEFYYFGKEVNKQNNIINIEVDYQKKELPSMIDSLRKHNIDIVFLWSKRQETFSYTYYEALTAGCYIITKTGSGNIADMVENKKNGKIFDDVSSVIFYLEDVNKVKNDISNYLDISEIPLEMTYSKDLETILRGFQFKNYFSKEYHNNSKYRKKALSYIYNRMRGN